MAPLPPPEPSHVLRTEASLDARKLRFEINRLRLPMGLEASFGIIRHPGASLAVPVLDDGRVVILRQYRFAVATRLLEFPAGLPPWSGSCRRRRATAPPAGIPSGRCSPVRATPMR
jgi:ADP-ribose pyrophosphatase